MRLDLSRLTKDLILKLSEEMEADPAAIVATAVGLFEQRREALRSLYARVSERLEVDRDQVSFTWDGYDGAGVLVVEGHPDGAFEVQDAGGGALVAIRTVPSGETRWV
jgi:hypothetical protein